MFSRISRYGKIADVVTTDAKGRVLQSRDIRLLPDVIGDFFHTVEELDRLDHLGYKYYDEPKKWWRVCDANPDFMSPHAMLGKEPIAISSFRLTPQDENPRWVEMLKRLSEKTGIEDVKLLEKIELTPEKGLTGDPELKKNYKRSSIVTTLVVTYNTVNISPGEIAQEIANFGFHVGKLGDIGRIGKKIVIPLDEVF